MLFTGDVEMAGEHEIVNYVQELTDQSLFQDDRIDVLKVAHHGSSGSSCEEFLEAIQPKISLISCGKNNSYGHPHTETLERLKIINSKVCNTAECGQITLEIKKGKTKLDVYRR